MTFDESPQQERERLEQEAIAWQIRHTSGKLPDEEAGRFEAWRRQSPAHAQAYRRMEALWQQLDVPLRAERKRRQEARKAPARAHPRRRNWGLAAAACLLLVSAASFYPDYLQNPLADYRTRIGEQAAVTLADGSIAYLNTHTALDVKITGQERRVRLLRGEAEFDVAHDSGRPFRVLAGNTVTEALGTRFVVRYDNPNGAITLLQGRVRATRLTETDARQESFVLQPGERSGFDQQRLAAPQSVDAVSGNAWQRGRLILNFVPLKHVIAEINRYRRQPIRLLDEAAGVLEINAAIDLTRIDAWLDALPATLPVRILRAGPFVMIGKKDLAGQN